MDDHAIKEPRPDEARWPVGGQFRGKNAGTARGDAAGLTGAGTRGTATSGQPIRGGWKTEGARRIGRGEVESRSNESLSGAGGSSDPHARRASSFAGVTVGGTGAGGNSRVGEPEQFGPWHGSRTGIGCDSEVCPVELGGAGWAVF